jgi:hypothetical protein
VATCTFAIGAGSTSAGPVSSGAFTPAANDLLVAFCAAVGTDGIGATCTSTGNTASWTNVANILLNTAGNGGRLTVWIQTALATAVSTNVTLTQGADNSTGNHIFIYRIAGMTNTGASAMRQEANDPDHAAGTPQAAALASSAITTNPTIVCVHDESNAVGWTAPTSWTEAAGGERAFSTPSSRCEVAHRDSGFTGTTVTWGSASTGEYASIVVEFDASAPSPAAEFHTSYRSIYTGPTTN